MSRTELAALAAAFELTDSNIEAEAEKIAGQVQHTARCGKSKARRKPSRCST